MIKNQYIDLFTQNRVALDANSVSSVNKHRELAFEAFRDKGFPNRKLEDFQYSDIESLFETNYGININRFTSKVNPYTEYKCNVADLSTNLYFLLNDSFHDSNLPQVSYPKGVYIGGLKVFSETHPDILDNYYGQISDVNKNGIVAFNTMFAQDGFVVYIPDNTILESPIQLMNILTGNADLLVNRRLLIIVGNNSEVKILACDHTVDDHKFLATQVTEIFAGENAHIDLYELEENSDRATRLASTFVVQQKSSNVLVNNITLNCGFTRNNYHVVLNGENAEATVAGVVIADRDQHVDSFAYLDHAKPHCQSTQLFKYVLQDNSEGVFCGRILVEKDAQKTMAYQTNNNLCMSPAARMYSKPQLEIYADDVKCSHGLTTGQLDQEALFYLQARGIPKADAKLLLMQAFTSSVLDLIRLDALKERLTSLVERRFSGESVRCGSCSVCK